MLVGGGSSRMGRDKALLPFGNGTLVEHVAAVVSAAAGSVTLVGDPLKYGRLGYPVVADTMAGAGPLAGIVTALSASHSDWNLVLACDMPDVSAAFLTRLLVAAESAGPDCLLPAGPSGRLEPLCAAYHLKALPAMRRALEQDVRKVLDGLAELRVTLWRPPEPQPFRNLNTPRDWNEYLKISKTREPGI